MAALALEITSPVDGQALVFGNPAPTVACSGRLSGTAPPGTPLYFRWYSSLSKSAARDLYSLNQPALTAADLPFTFAPDIGSHVITFAASDRAGELAADLRVISHAGVTGGAKGASRCLIHVYKAKILDLAAQAPRATVKLAAEAPWDWKGKGYQQHDRLHYRWVFEPDGAPAGRPTASFTPGRAGLTFRAKRTPNRVSFHPALPATALGPYRVTLFVEAGVDATAVRAHETKQVDLT